MTCEFACNNCQKGLDSIRYKCLQCFDFDLCEDCCENTFEAILDHDPVTHILVKLRIKSSSRDINQTNYQKNDEVNHHDNLSNQLMILDAMRIHYLDVCEICYQVKLSEEIVRETIDQIFSISSKNQIDSTKEEDLPKLCDDNLDDIEVYPRIPESYSHIDDKAFDLSTQWKAIQYLADIEDTDDIDSEDISKAATYLLTQNECVYLTSKYVPSILNNCFTVLDFAAKLHRIPNVQKMIYENSLVLLPSHKKQIIAIRNQLKTRLTKKVEISKILRAVEDVKSCIRVQLLGNKFLKSRLKSHRNKKVEDIVNVKSISYSEVSTIKEEFNTNFNSGITIFPAAENSATDMPDTETASIEMSVNCTKPELECAVTKMTQNLDSLISFENPSIHIEQRTDSLRKELNLPNTARNNVPNLINGLNNNSGFDVVYSILMKLLKNTDQVIKSSECIYNIDRWTISPECVFDENVTATPKPLNTCKHLESDSLHQVIAESESKPNVEELVAERIIETGEDIVNVKSISYSEVSTIKEEFNTNFNSGITIFPAAENSATDMPDTETASIEMSVNCTKPELECAVTKMTQNLDSLISFENRSDNIKLNTLNNMDYTFLESANPFKILDQSTENITINNESNFIITAFRSSMAEPIKSILRHKDATKHIDLSLIRVASRKRVRFQLEEIIDSIENLNISTNSNFTIEKQFSKKYKTNQK